MRAHGLASRQHRLARIAKRLTQLFEVLFVRERGRLVEPFGHHELRAGAFETATVDFANHAHESLRALRDGGRTKAERQAQRDVALVQLHLVDAQGDGCHDRSLQMLRTWRAEISAQPGPSGRYSKGSTATQPV